MNRKGSYLSAMVPQASKRGITIVLCGVALLGCTVKNAGHQHDASKDAATPACVDEDQDGFGAHCGNGPDCNDHDHSIHEHCQHCATPEESCACPTGATPVVCYLDKTHDDGGAIMCHEGTRSCRDGFWSACEDIHDYPLPERPGATTALISDAGPQQCNDCNVNCFSVTDQLSPADGGLTDSGLAFSDGGGLTLGIESLADASTPPPDAMAPPCVVGSGVGDDKDCDGIPDEFDPYPNTPPFATANPSIFLQIAPGQTGTGKIDLTFKVTAADVYFLVDQSGSMADERDALKASLTTGDFVNNASFDCSDGNFDHVPDNELKSKGIIGAVKCYIRDAQFGVGFFREIPFSGYAANDHIAFANYYDISNNIDGVLAAVGRLTTVGNNDWPEASMVALYQVLKGTGMYFGTQKRGILPRTNCPSGDWGYPCFRPGTVPIVVMFTDAQFHNGPDSGGGGSFPYSTGLSITAGTNSQYYPEPSTNETFNNAIDLGDVTSTYKTYAGSTETMANDISSTFFPCLTETTGSDAVFKFSLNATKAIKIETTGSQFDTLLGLYTGIPRAATSISSASGNEIASNAFDLGVATSQAWLTTGSTASMAADYNWSEVGCSASTTSPDAVFKFTTSATTQVGIDTSGSAFDTVIGLYNAAPTLMPTATSISNVNETYATPYSIGDMVGQNKVFSGNTGAMNSDYTGSQIGCNADNSSPDATFGFTLSASRKIRISTEGSSYDTVFGLFSGTANPVGSAAVTSTNENYSSAYNIGTLDGHILKLTGTTTGMAGDYFGNQVGCNAATAAPDAVFKFHLNSTRNIQLDTIGTSWDTVLALYNQSPNSTTNVSTNNTNESFTNNVQNLGVVNNKDLVISGGDTTGMAADFSTTQDNCATSYGGLTAPDAAYKFQVTGNTTVRLDMSGTSFDTTVALHALPPDEAVTPIVNTNDTLATAINVGNIVGTSFQRSGDTSGLAHNYMFPLAYPSSPPVITHASARDAVFQFSLASAKTVQIDTSGSSFDTSIGLFNSTVIPNPATSSTTSAASSNNASSSPYAIGTMDDAWRVLTGSTSSATNDWSDNHCSTASGSPDVYFSFTLNSTRTISIALDTTSFSNSRFILYNGSLSSGSYNTCGSTSAVNSTLSAGTYYIAVKGASNNSKGNYSLIVKDVTAPIATNDDVSVPTDRTSLVTAALNAGTYTVVVSSPTNAYGAYTIRFRDVTWWNSFGLLACNDGASNGALVSQLLTPGNYGIIVKGKRSSAGSTYGAYKLRVTDTDNPPSGVGVLTCDDNGGGSNTSKIVQTLLPAGDYWAVLKGTSSTAAGSYTLNIKDSSATASGALVQCDDDSGDAPGSMVETTLAAGSYQVVLKGKTPAAKGAYKLSLRDVTALPINRIGCDNDSGATTGSSHLSASLAAGTYYVALKGRTSTASGAYNLSIRDEFNVPNTTNMCDDDSSTYSTSKISTTLNSGTYYVAIKGYNAAANGPYQLSIGGGTTTTATYTPPSWTTTLNAVKSTGAHVITILSCHDDPSYGDAAGDCVQARYQANTLASQSQALGTNNNNLVFDIDRDGTGLSGSVVSAITQLANYLAMNVQARVVFTPDANPGFIVNVTAVDQAGDGCSGLIGIEHQNCLPGATPEFLITFENPSTGPVPLNPRTLNDPTNPDPNGGYYFKAQLIGNGTFVVDEIPIYIIPEAPPVPPVPPPNYYNTGSYSQEITANTCSQTQAPDWSDLTWNAEIYQNTAVTFTMCTATTADGLNTCTQHEVGRATGTAACSATTPCAAGNGFCDTTVGVCQLVLGATCTAQAQCPSNAVCDSTQGRCLYSSQPVYTGSSLGADNFKPYMKMTVALSGVEPITNPPVVHSWAVNYECRNSL